VTGRRGRGSKHLLDDLKETSWYFKLKKEALYLVLWRTRFERDCGSFELEEMKQFDRKTDI
jgi:hypothetical protein